MREKNWASSNLIAEIISNLGSKLAPMTTYAATLLYTVLGLLAIILLLFCSVTFSVHVHSEIHSLGNYVVSFLFLFTTLCYRFYMVDGKLAGTSSIVKAISKLRSCIIHVVPAVFVLQGWSTWTSSVPEQHFISHSHYMVCKKRIK